MNSFTKQYNLINSRNGPIFLRGVKKIDVFTPEQFLHLIRYINLNPISSGMIKDIETLVKYDLCSFHEYLHKNKRNICDTAYVLRALGGRNRLKQFILDRAEYQQKLEIIKKTK